MRGTRAFVAGAALCLLTATPAAAAPGGPDPTFGKGGYTYASFGIYDSADAVMAQGDKVVVAGRVGYGSSVRATSSFLVTRYQANGLIDRSFGSGGATTLSVGQAAWAYSLTPLTDGRFLVGGTTFGPTRSVAVARLSADGRPDASFGKNGIALAPLRDDPRMTGVAAMVDGSFVVSGVVWKGKKVAVPFLQRFLADGRPDTSFGTGGTLFPTIGAYPVTFPTSIVALPDGSVVVAGKHLDDNLGLVPFLVRYLPNGLQDPVFGSIAMVDLAGSAFETLALAPDGRYVVGGARGKAGDSYADPLNPLIGRYLPTGTPDPTFGTNGLVSSTGLDATVFDVGLLTDGRVVAVGVGVGRRGTDPLLWRVTALGAHDTTFGRNGVAAVGHPTLGDGYNGLVVGANNAVTAVGMTWTAYRDRTDSVIARFLG